MTLVTLSPQSYPLLCPLPDGCLVLNTSTPSLFLLPLLTLEDKGTSEYHSLLLHGSI